MDQSLRIVIPVFSGISVSALGGVLARQLTVLVEHKEHIVPQVIVDVFLGGGVPGVPVQSVLGHLAAEAGVISVLKRKRHLLRNSVKEFIFRVCFTVIQIVHIRRVIEAICVYAQVRSGKKIVEVRLGRDDQGSVEVFFGCTFRIEENAAVRKIFDVDGGRVCYGPAGKATVGVLGKSNRRYFGLKGLHASLDLRRFGDQVVVLVVGI